MTALPPNRTRKRSIPRVAAIAAAAAVLSIAAACSSDTVTAPQASGPHLTAAQSRLADAARLLGSPLIATLALERNDALPEEIVRSVKIGTKGGEIEIKEAGLKVKVPEGAIMGGPITITVTAVAGKVVAYTFEPHGTQFAKGLQFEQSLDNTTWDKLKLKGKLTGGYFKTLDQLDLFGKAALLDETYPVTLDRDKVLFNIWHFSGYMVSTGRSEEPSSEMF